MGTLPVKHFKAITDQPVLLMADQPILIADLSMLSRSSLMLHHMLQQACKARRYYKNRWLTGAFLLMQ